MMVHFSVINVSVPEQKVNLKKLCGYMICEVS